MNESGKKSWWAMTFKEQEEERERRRHDEERDRAAREARAAAWNDRFPDQLTTRVFNTLMHFDGPEEVTVHGLLRIRNCGRKTVKEIRDLFKSKGWLRMEAEEELRMLSSESVTPSRVDKCVTKRDLLAATLAAWPFLSPRLHDVEGHEIQAFRAAVERYLSGR